MAFELQDPDETLTWTFDYTDWEVAGVTLDSFATAVSPAGPTLVDGAVASGLAPVNVSDVVFGKTYRIECRGTLSTAEIVTKTLVLRGGSK